MYSVFRTLSSRSLLQTHSQKLAIVNSYCSIIGSKQVLQRMEMLNKRSPALLIKIKSHYLLSAREQLVYTTRQYNQENVNPI